MGLDYLNLEHIVGLDYLKLKHVLGLDHLQLKHVVGLNYLKLEHVVGHRIEFPPEVGPVLHCTAQNVTNVS